MEIFTTSIPLQWIQEIFFSPGKNIEFFEDRLFTSQSTLNRLLLEINDYLKQIKLEILRSNNQYEIIGKNERHLRQIMAGFLLELHGFNLTEWSIQIDLNLVREIIHDLLRKNLKADEVSFILKDDLSIIYFVMFYLVSLIRENQGFHDASYYKKNDHHVLERSEFKRLKKSFPNITPLSIEPIHAFILSQYIGWDDTKEQNKVEKEAQVFFKNFLSAKEVTVGGKQLKNLEFILKSMYLTQKSIPFRTSTLFDRIYYFAITVKKHNYPLYHLIEINLTHFSKKTGVDLSSKLSQCVYWICLFFPEINYASGSINILIISDLGMNHAHFMARYLQNYFKNDYNDLTFHIESYVNLSKKYFFNDYQIIVSTILDLSIEHDNIVLINDYPTEANMFELYKASRKVLNKDSYSLFKPHPKKTNNSPNLDK